MFEITTKYNVVGKPNVGGLANQLSLFSGPYEVYRMDTMQDLLDYAYYEGRAYCHGVVDVDQHTADLAEGVEKTSTPRSYAYFKYADLISVDIDKPTFSEHTLEYIRAQEWAADVGLIYPSSSYTPSAPRWHLVFRLSERLTDRHEYMALAAAFYQLINLPVDDALASPIQLSFGTVFRDPTIEGKPAELTYVNEEAVLSVEWLRALSGYVAPQQVEEIPPYEEPDEARNYVNSEEGSYRVKLHMKQNIEDRERVVIDALAALLPVVNETTTRERWNAIWMAAHHGAPTSAVRDMLLQLSEKMRPDGHAGRIAWAREWASHKNREDGYTVATLFWLAERYGGWLRYTPFDVSNDKFTHLIEVPTISAWLEEMEDIPARVVLHSQTGSGKSYAIGFLWRKLEKPKTVVFVPTMKLAADMVATLTKLGLPVTLYYDHDSGIIKDGDTLRAAPILVTTLQTFVTRVHNLPGMMANYGLVYVEESDQLIAQFSLAKNLLLPSHVSEEQSRRGFAILQEACELSRSVWFVDGTLTQISVDAARALCPAEHPPMIVRNTNTKPKPDVELLHTKEQAYNLAIIALLKGKKVVVACDTKATATEFFEIVQDFGIQYNSEILLITKNTEKQPEVIDFMREANEGAKKYDLVVYNSVMASGVSITSVQPDVVVQIAEYLAPRNNLQILNRYRSQREVYVYYGQHTSLYGKTAEEIRRAAEEKVRIEAAMLGLPVLSRSAIADLREYLGSIASADVYAQLRDARAFYKRLLQDDGRKVYDRTRQVILEGLDVTLDEVRAARKERKEYVRQNWRNVMPIGPDSPATAGMTALEIACGLEHYGIFKTLNDFIPQDAEPERIFDVVHAMRPSAVMLSVFSNQPAAYRMTEAFLSDPETPDTTFHNNVTRLTLLTLLLDVWGDDLSHVWTLEQLDTKGVNFLSRLDAAAHTYDFAVRMSAEDYKEVLQKYETVGERTLAFSKALLDTVGLKVKKVGKFRGEAVYGIDNLDDALDFLRWRHHWVTQDFVPDFAGTAVALTRSQQHEAAQLYAGMTEADRMLVMSRWNGDKTTFHYAVKSVVEDIEWT